MADLLSRMKDAAPFFERGGLLVEAAAEIERLRERLELAARLCESDKYLRYDIAEAIRALEQ